MIRTTPQAVEILLVEDNPGDARLAAGALRDGGLRIRLHHVVDGVEALAFLRREDPWVDAPRPALILLDLNLPRKNGLEVLAEVKADPVLRRIPVVVLTTSAAEEEVGRAYDLHANCYITKPLEIESFLRVMRTVEAFWLTVARLPRA
ncbi:MAG: response regulator [Deltaproteobacteria bacterium]|nr:response regulator [Deltaproteobacteria bacterium]